jgi:PPK2 family polyphosphate:nucleotide phosphotransferase
MNHEHFIVPPDKKISLKDYDPKFTGRYHDKQEATEKLQNDIKELVRLQDILYAHGVYGILIILQALDAAGKDGTIKHVMSGVNPQGCQVYSFKAPSIEELDHDYLWRCMKALPEKGRIGIFNRSYYEEVLVVRVHNELLEKQKLPPNGKKEDLWQQRFEEINQFEKYLVKNGIIVLKFYLNVSKEEQKKRFLKRINQPEKNWKFSLADVNERAHWKEYQKAYGDLFCNTSTKYAPWYIIPADNKWYTRAAVADIIVCKLKELKLEYPNVSEEHKRELLKVKEILENEK